MKNSIRTLSISSVTSQDPYFETYQSTKSFTSGIWHPSAARRSSSPIRIPYILELFLICLKTMSCSQCQTSPMEDIGTILYTTREFRDHVRFRDVEADDSSFGNQIANIGIVNGSLPGKYLIRRADDVFEPPTLQAGNDTLDNTTESLYQGVVNLPTTYGTMLIRLLVLHNTTEELATLHAYQNASRLVSLNRTTPQANISTTPKLTSQALNG